MCQMLERAGQMHSQHQRQFFWKDPPELLLSKALKMTLYIQLQEPVNIVFRQAAPAQPVQVSIDALVEVLSRPRDIIKAQASRCENMCCIQQVLYRLQAAM